MDWFVLFASSHPSLCSSQFSAGAGKDIGLQIWRIEKFQVKRWPKESFGASLSHLDFV